MPTMQIPLPADLTKKALTYGPAFVGAGIWLLARYPEQLKWAEDGYAKSFGAIATLYDEWTNVDGYGEAFDEAIDETRATPKRILDLATGTGFAAKRLARRFPDAEVVGIDLSEEMIAVAQHQVVAEDLNIRFEVMDSRDLDFTDETFDLVTLLNSIAYPEEMLRVLKPSGRAVVAYSFAGPWVAMAWPALQTRFEAAGAEYVWGSRAGSGFYGVARKAGSTRMST